MTPQQSSSMLNKHNQHHCKKRQLLYRVYNTSDTYINFPHFTDEETEAERSEMNLVKITKVSGAAGVRLV